MRNANTAMKAGEAMGAAASVIAARAELAALHYAQPTLESGVEMDLMLSEKVDAFTQAGAAVADGAADMAGRNARFAVKETAEASKAFFQFAACRTPAELMAVQARMLTGFFGRSYAHGLGLNSVAAKTGEKALAPVHKAVTENKTRLGKKGG
jgi:hypothetical protein